MNTIREDAQQFITRHVHGLDEHLCNSISDALAVACRIDAQRNVQIGRRVKLRKVYVSHLFKSHIVIGQATGLVSHTL